MTHDEPLPETATTTATPRGAMRPRPRGPETPSLGDTLREEIVALKLAPGAVLDRKALQERFGVSSTPVRDALLRLRDEGLVDIFPQHATLVSPIDLGIARQAQFLRRSLETECVRLLAGDPRPAVIGRLESLIRQLEVFHEVGELEAFSQADKQFHRTFFEANAAEELWMLLQSRNGQIDRLRNLHMPVEGKMAEIVRDHRAIVERIAARDAEGASRVLRDHLSRSLSFSSTLRERFPGYFRAPA